MNGQGFRICTSTIFATPSRPGLHKCGVDYAVIQTLKGEPLPGSAKYYIHNWNVRLRDAVKRLEVFTKTVVSAGKTLFRCHFRATILPRPTCKSAKYGAEGQNRTVDTSLFRAVLCQLSYLGIFGMTTTGRILPRSCIGLPHLFAEQRFL